MSTGNQNVTKPSILITGGSGFLGQRIVQEFLATDSKVQPANISIFDLNDYPGNLNDKIEFVKGDIRNYEEVKNACKGKDIVVHSAAVVDWGTKSDEEIFGINVGGTENIIKACNENKVPYLVYTSSLDAVYEGKPLVDIDESQPYPEKHATTYCRSKYLAEKKVLEANSENLKTMVLRPADIFGEADPFHMDTLINMAKSGFYVRIGDGKALNQHVYVGNMAYAHVLAADALMKKKDVAGKVYFITDSEPSNFFKFFDKLVLASGYKIFPKNFWLPKGLSYTIGGISELTAVLARPFYKYTPKFSRFAVTYTCTDFTFKATRAEKELGFVPKYDEETVYKSIASYYKKQ
jgi:nucleoside-diphosphate-sugar epimerase